MVDCDGKSWSEIELRDQTNPGKCAEATTFRTALDLALGSK
jgi:hypothetical protein